MSYIYMFPNQKLYRHRETHINFLHNTAMKGGKRKKGKIWVVIVRKKMKKENTRLTKNGAKGKVHYVQGEIHTDKQHNSHFCVK